MSSSEPVIAAPAPGIGASAASPANRASTLAAVDPVWAWSIYEPNPSRPWNIALAAHLYRRAAFGGTVEELQRAVELGPGSALEHLLRAPTELVEYAAAQDAREVSSARSGDSQTFQAWWLRRLIESPYPYLEKVTLFWHAHFAIGASQTGDVALFQKHIHLLRAGALGGFSALLGAMLEDPAMYVALGGAQNRRAQPNLAFARPWLESFTVGAGTAQPEDVQGAARAFTGWFVYGGRLRFIEREHDEAEWTVLGRQGAFGRKELLNLLVAHPATASHLAKKLFRGFVSEAAEPSEALLAPLAERLRRSGNLHEGIEMILRSNLLFSEHALRQKIKSPVDLAVGLARSLKGVPPCPALASDLGRLGQRLDEPPTVHGWPTGTDWINSISLAARLRLSRDLLSGSGEYGNSLDPWRPAADHGCKTVADAAKFWLDLLLQDQLSPGSARPILEAAQQAKTGAAGLRPILASITSRPEFQLH